MGAPPSGSEFNSTLVGIDRRDVDHRPDPSHRAGKTDRQDCNTKLEDRFLGIARIEIVGAECAEKNTENNERHAVFCVRVRFEGERGCGCSGRNGRNRLRTEKHAAYAYAKARKRERCRLCYGAGKRRWSRSAAPGWDGRADYSARRQTRRSGRSLRQRITRSSRGSWSNDTRGDFAACEAQLWFFRGRGAAAEDCAATIFSEAIGVMRRGAAGAEQYVRLFRRHGRTAIGTNRGTHERCLSL